MSTPGYGRAFWIALPLGAAVMTVGAVGLVTDIGLSGGVDVARWLVGADLAHDLLLAPLACLVGAAAARVLPRRCRAPVQAGLLASGVLLLVALPALRGYGRDTVPDNPSVQPLEYTTATLTVLAVVWAAAAAWLAIRFVRRRTSPLATSDRGRRRPPTRATRGGRRTSRR